ncbi:MAG: hypothetical protein M3347_09125, partial [Armatimonadota bacterium]|nr:hypothetical protein [Armatimonadota bacterium]
GVTLSVTRAGFFERGKAFEGLRATRSWGAPQAGRKGFSVRYLVRRDVPLQAVPGEPPLPPHDSVRYYQMAHQRNDATTARLFASSGELLAPSSGADEERGQRQLDWVAVDPHWDHVTFEVLALDPAAPLAASGNFMETLEFKEVPLPRRFNQPKLVGQTLTTHQGTPVTLESIEAETETNAEGETQGSLHFVVRWQAPAAAPDLQASFEMDGIADMDGKPLPMQGWGSRGGSKGGMILSANVLPPLRLKNIVVKIGVTERAPSLRQMQGYRRFRCELKLPPLVAVSTPPSSPLPTVENSAGVIAALEKPPWMGMSDRMATWLWLRDRAADRDSMQRWFLKSLKARDQNRRNLEASWTPSGATDETRVAWRSDGIPVAPGEQCEILRVQWGNDPRPNKVTLEATVEARRYLHHVADFADVSLPAPGETREVNASIQPQTDAPDVSTTGARIILRRVLHFDNPSTLRGLYDWQHAAYRRGGIAALFEVVPALKGSEITLRATLSEDEAGRPLHSSNHINVVAGDALTKTPPAEAAPEGRWWTVVLQPSAPNAQKLRIQVVVDETLSTGESATLSFPDVIPPTPLHGTG